MNRTLIKAILGAVVIATWATLSADETATETAETPADSNTIRVTTKPLTELVFATEYSAPATVVSLNDSSISAEIQGRAIKIEAEVGDVI